MLNNVTNACPARRLEAGDDQIFILLAMPLSWSPVAQV